MFLRDLNRIAGARVAADARVALLDRERAEAAQFHPVAARKRRGDFLENRGHDTFDIAMIEMWIEFRDALDQLGLRHGLPSPKLTPCHLGRENGVSDRCSRARHATRLPPPPLSAQATFFVRVRFLPISVPD